MMEVTDSLHLAPESISLEGPEAHPEGHPSSFSFQVQNCEAHLQAQPGGGSSLGNQEDLYLAWNHLWSASRWWWYKITR